MSKVLETPMPVGSFSTVDKEVQRLRSENDLYSKYSPLWKFYMAAYEGGEAFANGSNIFRHVREPKEDYEDRVKRIHNMNYCEPLVDYFSNFIFSEPIDRNGGINKDFFDTFTTDVNLRGDNIDKFMKTVCRDTHIFGMTYVLVDAPVVTSELSKQQEIDGNIRPYWVTVNPDEVLDWVLDDFGNYVYLKRRQHRRDLLPSGKIILAERFTEFYKDHIHVSVVDVSDSKKPVVVDQFDLQNTVNEIPIRVCKFKSSIIDPPIGASFLRDFAFNNREILNLSSLIQEFLYRQAFNILAMESSDVVPTVDQTNGEAGTANVVNYPHGGKAPSYISPPVDPAEFLQSERTRVQLDMFSRAAQDSISALANGGKSSGFSQAQSFSKTVPYIASRAETLEETENSLMILTMKRMGKTWDGKIKYKDRYELTNLTDAMTQLMTLARDLQLPSKRFVQEELKRMVREYDGKLPKEALTEIENNIDKMDFKEWQDVQRQALVGRGSSPGEQQKSKQVFNMAEAKAEATQEQPAATNKLAA